MVGAVLQPIGNSYLRTSGGLDLTGKAAVLKTAGRKPLGVRVPRPPLNAGTVFTDPAFSRQARVPARISGRRLPAASLADCVESPALRGFAALAVFCRAPFGKVLGKVSALACASRRVPRPPLRLSAVSQQLRTDNFC